MRVDRNAVIDSRADAFEILLSAQALVLCWVGAAAVLTKQYKSSRDEVGSGCDCSDSMRNALGHSHLIFPLFLQDLVQFMRPTVVTWIVASPLWLLTEYGGGMLGGWLTTPTEDQLSAAILSTAASSTDLLVDGTVSALWLFLTMITSRYVSYIIP